MPFIDNPSEINVLTSGIVSEVFFMEACNRMGLNCIPTRGYQDSLGADFMIENGKETRFLDVSLDTSKKGLEKKNKVGTFPTIFIPWRTNRVGKRKEVSYSEKYLCTGVFNRRKFFSDILNYNYRNLHILERDVRKGSYSEEGYMGAEGFQYVNDLKGTISMLRGMYN